MRREWSGYFDIAMDDILLVDEREPFQHLSIWPRERGRGGSLHNAETSLMSLHMTGML
jgi:hypothetical protein